jgi:hypothetical protein
MKLRRKITKQFDVPFDEDGAWVKIRNLTLNEIKKVDSKVNKIKMVANIDSGEGETSVSFDPYARLKLLAKLCIVDWFGFEDEFGKDIPFSKKNIDVLENVDIETEDGFIDFFSWIDKCRAQVDEEFRTEEEKAAKN